MRKLICMLIVIQALVSGRISAQQNPVYDWGKRLLSSASGSAVCTAMAAEYSPLSLITPQTITGVYIAGNFNGSISIPELNTTLISTGVGNDIFIIKINPSGTAVYATTISSSAADDQANDICLQRNLNGSATAVFVTGKSNGTFLLEKFNPDLTMPANNTVLTSVPSGSGSGFAIGRGIVVVGSTLYVAGSVNGVVQIDFSDYLGNTVSLYSPVNMVNLKYLMVCSFNTSLQPLDGVVPFTFAGPNEAYDIAYGASRLFITGYYKSSIQFGSLAGTSIPSCSGDMDIFLASLSTNLSGAGFDKTDQKRAGGGQAFTNQFNWQDIGYSVAFSANSIYMIGGVSPLVSATVDNSPAFTGSGFLAKFPFSSSSIGNLTYYCKMTNNTNGLSTRPFGLSIDPGFNVLITGYANAGGKVYDVNNTNFIQIPGSMTSGDPCGFIAKYNQNGGLIWADRINQQVYNGSTTSTLCGQAILASKCDVYYAGQLSTANSTTFGTNPPFNIAGSYVGANAFVARLSNSLAMSDDTTICFFSPLAYAVLNASGASNYSWTVTPSTGVTITTPTSASPTVTISNPGTYTFTCTSTVNYNSTTACSQTGSCVVTAMFCSRKAQSEDISPAGDLGIFPNPSSGQFTVKWDYSGGYSLEMFDLAGNLLVKQQVPGESTLLDPGEMGVSSGLYLLKLTASDGRVRYEKVIFNRP